MRESGRSRVAQIAPEAFVPHPCRMTAENLIDPIQSFTNCPSQRFAALQP